MDVENSAGGSEGEGEKDSSLYEPILPKYLSTAYEVLRRIFSFLPLEDVESAAEAFKSWKPIADVTRKERHCVESFIVSDQKYNMTKIWAEADFCISFSTANNREVEKKITKYMNPGGEFCHCLTGAGIIGTVNDLSQLVQQKVRVGLSSSQRKYYFSILRISSMPRVGIKTFLWEEGMDFGSFKSSCDIPPNEIIKCVIILMITEGSVQKANMQKNDFINFLQSRQDEDFAIGGSVIDSFGNYFTSSSSASMIKYIVFYGDNVEAASTVLTSEVRSMSSVNDKIRMLKEVCPVTKQGALFVFRCTGRHRLARGKVATTNISKWEGDSIQKFFPSTPVVGCFGYGEFGREYPTNDGEVPSKKLKRLNWEFSFSTSLVYIGFMKR